MHLRRAINICLFIVLFIPKCVFSFSFDQIELHHIFPRQYSGWFSERNIDPDLYCIALTREKHTGKGVGIHHYNFKVSGGLSYNDSWGKFFIRKYPTASDIQCFDFASVLLAEFGLVSYKEKLYEYKTRKESSKRIPRTKFINSVEGIIERVVKLVNVSPAYVGRTIPYLFIAYETYSFLSEFDDKYNFDYLDRAFKFAEQAELLDIEKNPDEVLQKVANSYFFLGIFFYSNIISKIDNISSEIAYYFDENYQKKVDYALKFLNKSALIYDKLSINFGEVNLYLGNLYILKSDKENGIKFLKRALNCYQANGDSEMIEFLEKIISQAN